jgi:hypothetical protein
MWSLVLGWLEVRWLLRRRPLGRLAEQELERRGVVFACRPQRVRWPAHTAFYYWGGYFADLRGERCTVLLVKPWWCPTCRRHKGQELEVRPVRQATPNRWHLYLSDPGGWCGCPARQDDVLSLRR